MEQTLYHLATKKEPSQVLLKNARGKIVLLARIKRDYACPLKYFVFCGQGSALCSLALELGAGFAVLSSHLAIKKEPKKAL